MSKKVLVFGASTSSKSINKQLAQYAASLLEGVELNQIDLNDFDMPVFNVDREETNGIPEQAYAFKNAIKQADGIIISFAEHNGAYAAAYKNIFDWVSRIEKEFWYNKPMLLMATSPGPRGAKSVLEIATKAYSRVNKNVVSGFSLPSFYDHFDSETGLKDMQLKQDLQQLVEAFKLKFV